MLRRKKCRDVAGHLLLFESSGSQTGTENWFCQLGCQDLLLRCQSILKQLRGVSALLEMLQENELLELSLSPMVPQSLGCLLRDLKVFSVMLARRSSGISHVAEQGLHHRAASCYRTMGHSFPCVAKS